MLKSSTHGSRTKSQSGKIQVFLEWREDKTQSKPKTEVEQFLMEERDVDREETLDGLQ